LPARQAHFLKAFLRLFGNCLQTLISLHFQFISYRRTFGIARAFGHVTSQQVTASAHNSFLLPGCTQVEFICALGFPSISRCGLLVCLFIPLSLSLCLSIYWKLGGVCSPSGRPPRNREIVSFRACVRRAVSGCEEESKCKSKA
jgi:hypothetical protein